MHDKQSQDETGVVMAFLERFEKFRLPRTMELKERVDQGEVLETFDMDFLHRVFEDAQEVKTLVDERPDLQDLYTRAVNLYHEITERALQNEERAQGNAAG
ncbi:hypothetical protein [Rhabdochromatium marinum]|uniref:hypothetical protein n=1 Tax=Rhabdochromatium marinum TaxID=48729 RepID=UPI0019079CB4|nr:hypothetical protein [Rhabdochromatium marinum]MBK1648740.1 hypothetical protein [Rhabdochromatium marinum]